MRLENSMYHAERVLVAVGFAAAVATLSHVGCAPMDSREVRGFRLTEKSLTGVREVASILAREHSPQADRPRSDGAILFQLFTSSPGSGVGLVDSTVTDTLRQIESNHPDLQAAIVKAGLTPREYVLTQIALLQTVPVVIGERSGEKLSTVAAPENMEFVRTHLAEASSILEEVYAAGRPKP